MSVVDTVAIETVMEARAACADQAAAAAALASALASARAPRRAPEATCGSTCAPWRLVVDVSASAPGIKVADARIVDDEGRVVAERSLSDRTAASCTPLARAVGAWAQILLDDELLRAHEAAERRVDPPPPETQPIVVTTTAIMAMEGEDRPSAGESGDATAGFEIGTNLFLRNGVASTGGMFGAAPFVTIGLSRTLVLRPSAMIGTSTSKVPPDASKSANVTLFGGRIDLCRRFPGNYLDHRGIEFDGCAGADVAYVESEIYGDALRSSVGPSAVVRGELGSNFGLEIRGMVGANLARAGFGPDAPFFVAAAEVGGSVRFR